MGSVGLVRGRDGCHRLHGELAVVFIGHWDDSEALDYWRKLMDNGSMIGMETSVWSTFCPTKASPDPHRVR